MSDEKQPDWLDDYVAFCDAAGYLPLVDWSHIRMTGRDRASFLHGLCTNEIKKLPAGNGCEAFVTNVQGKTIGHIVALATDSALDIVAPCAQAATLISHWDRYLIREQVTMEDASATTVWVALAGAQAESLLRNCESCELGADRWSHGALVDGGRQAVVARWSLDRPLFLLGCAADELSEWTRRLEELGATRVQAAAWDALRIELGWPLFGRDIMTENLPQEVARDASAISLTKGCYLGQETVARIDALGHVNRSLRGLKLSDDVPCEPGVPWHHEGKISAYITSLSYSPRLGSRLALAYVRRAWERPGSRLPLPAGQVAEVLALPVSAAAGT